MTLSPVPTSQLATPCLLLDHARMQHNISSFNQHLQSLGTALRPHVKTAKSMDVVHAMVEAQSAYAGLTVSTLAEADYLFEHGMNKLLYAVGIAPGKLAAVAERIRQGMDLTLVLDATETAEHIAEAAASMDTRFKVLIEIDADDQRAGIRPDDGALIEIAKRLKHSQVELAGVMTHMGGSYHCRDRPCLIKAAKTERDAAVLAANRLSKAGYPCKTISLGSTPSARFAQDLSGVSEVRIGTYVFMDLVMAALGVCSMDDIAISVLTEVIGHRRHSGELLIDAGWMALSRDRGTAAHAIDQGYGVVCDEHGHAFEHLIVRSADQEHGIVAERNGQAVDLKPFPIGRRLRILPNHACATAAQHSGYWLLEEDRRSCAWWPRMSGWT